MTKDTNTSNSKLTTRDQEEIRKIVAEASKVTGGKGARGGFGDLAAMSKIIKTTVGNLETRAFGETGEVLIALVSQGFTLMQIAATRYFSGETVSDDLVAARRELRRLGLMNEKALAAVRDDWNALFSVGDDIEADERGELDVEHVEAADGDSAALQ